MADVELLARELIAQSGPFEFRVKRGHMTLAGRARIESVAEARARIPTDKDLAQELKVSPSYVRKIMRALRKRMSVNHDTVKRGTNMGESVNASST